MYMRQPLSYINKKHPNHVCKMNKAIYGLHQALRTWYEKFSSALHNFGFITSQSDPSLFILISNDKTMYILLYVDDIIIIGSYSSLIQEVISILNNKFILKDLCKLSYFLGIFIDYDNNGLF
jgi:histone deacetylase 1/2